MIERIVSYRSIFIADHEFVLGSCCKVYYYFVPLPLL